ncbi:MAG: EpsG family protein [Clostridiaceae bacterium]
MVITFSEGGTILFYILVITASVLLMHFADKKNSRFLLGVLILLLSCVIGFRYYVGKDFENYVNAYKIISKQGSISQAKAWYTIETSYIYLSFISKALMGNFQFVFFFYGFFTTLFFMLGIWYFRRQINVDWAMMYYASTFFFGSFNTIRQYMAMAIIFFAFRYVIEKKWIHYFIAVGIAVLFHTSAIVTVIIYFYGIHKNHVGRMMRIFNYIGPVVLILGANKVISFVSKLGYDRASNYEAQSHFGFGIIIQIIILVLFLRSCKHNNGLQGEKQYFIRQILILSTILCILDYTTGQQSVSRIRNYFSTIEMLAMASYPSVIFRNRSKLRFPKITIYDAFLCGYYVRFLGMSFIILDSWVYPYQFMIPFR